MGMYDLVVRSDICLDIDVLSDINVFAVPRRLETAALLSFSNLWPDLAQVPASRHRVQGVF